jgi:hypothetical protein
MTTRTNLKAGRRNNHNETLVRDAQAPGLKTKTRVRGGVIFKIDIKCGN